MSPESFYNRYLWNERYEWSYCREVDSRYNKVTKYVNNQREKVFNVFNHCEKYWIWKKEKNFMNIERFVPFKAQIRLLNDSQTNVLVDIEIYKGRIAVSFNVNKFFMLSFNSIPHQNRSFRKVPFCIGLNWTRLFFSWRQCDVTTQNWSKSIERSLLKSRQGYFQFLFN